MAVTAIASGVTIWTRPIKSPGMGLLPNGIDSWITGVNRKTDGKQIRIINRYDDNAPA